MHLGDFKKMCYWVPLLQFFSLFDLLFTNNNLVISVSVHTISGDYEESHAH